MNRLSVVFIAASLAAAGGLAIAQSQMGEGQDPAMDHSAMRDGGSAKGATVSDGPAV
jgi:hypothetical protein